MTFLGFLKFINIKSIDQIFGGHSLFFSIALWSEEDEGPLGSYI